MKKNIFLSLVVFLSTSLLFSQQIKLINKTVSDKNSRTIYLGVDNEFEIQSENFKGIQPQDGVLLAENIIKIFPKVIGKFTINFLTNEGEYPISFNVRTIPNPMPALNGQTTKEIFKNSIVNQKQLSLKNLNDDDTFFDNYKIVSFHANLDGTSYEISGDNFSNELITAINKTKNDAIFVISDIKAFNEAVNKGIDIKSVFSYKIK